MPETQQGSLKIGENRVKRVRVYTGTRCRLAVLGLTLALGAVACGEKSQASNSGRGPGGPGGRGGRIAVVETGQVEVGSIARRVTVSGTVEPIRSVGINSQLAGALVAVNVQEGDAVQAGTILARLDDRELKAQYASAEAAYEVAEATFQRAERLRERQVVTEAEYDRDRAAMAAASAQLQQLRTRLDYTTIRAPVSGVITEKRVETGDIVGNQTRLFTIAEMDTLVVRVHVSELDVVELSQGDMAAVTLDAYPDRRLSGRIRRIFPAADPNTRLVPVEVALHKDAARIARVGFLARVELALGTRDGVLLVPASAVVGDASSPAVFVVQDNIALRRSVRTGLTSEGRVEILSGLSAGETIVVAGNNTLRDGAQVRVVATGGIAAEEIRQADNGTQGGAR